MLAKGYAGLVLCEVFLIGAGPVALVLPILILSGNRARFLSEEYIPDANQVSVLVILAGLLVGIIFASRLVQYYKPTIVQWCLSRVPKVGMNRKELEFESRWAANVLMVAVTIFALGMIGHPAISVGLSVLVMYLLGVFFLRLKFRVLERSSTPSQTTGADVLELSETDSAGSKHFALSMLGAMQDALLILTLSMLVVIKMENLGSISVLVITFILIRYELRFLHAAGVSSMKSLWARGGQ